MDPAFLTCCILVVVGVAVGLILAFIGAIQFERYGASIYVADLVGIFEIDAGQLRQGEIALAFLGCADLAFHCIACTQTPFADLVRRDIDIVRPS